MLTENDVVDRLSHHLKTQGYHIIQELKTNQKGIDLVAEKKGERLYVEAKGETSSKPHTNRYGKPFTANQINSHISRAILTSMKVLNSKSSEARISVAIALPETKGHKKVVYEVINPLHELGITIFWINQEGVQEE